MTRWIYHLSPVREGATDAPTDDVAAALEERADYHRALKQAGILVLAGPPQSGPGTWAVTIIEVPDEATARAVMQTDPTVSAGVMTATLHPYILSAPQGPSA